MGLHGVGGNHIIWKKKLMLKGRVSPLSKRLSLPDPSHTSVEVYQPTYISGGNQKTHRTVLSQFRRVWLFAALWTVACQSPLPMGFPRQEYWGWLPFPPPGDLQDPGIEAASLMSPALAGGFFITSATWEAQKTHMGHKNHICDKDGHYDHVYLTHWLQRCC